MRTPLSRSCLIALTIAGLLPVQTQVEAAYFPWSRRYLYSLRISRSSQHQVAPGDFVEIGITSGPEGLRERQPVVRKAQVVKISESQTNTAVLSVTMNRKEIASMSKALSAPQSSLYVRIVQKQPRRDVDNTAAGDGIPDLDFESDDLLAKNPSSDPQ